MNIMKTKESLSVSATTEGMMIWRCEAKSCGFVTERWIKTLKVICCPKCNSHMQPEVE